MNEDEIDIYIGPGNEDTELSVNKTELQSESTPSDSTQQIAKRAYELYEKRRRQDGHADEEIRKNKPPENPKRS